MALAAALRIDNLMVIPRLTDETREVVLGLTLARHGGLPLTGIQAYTGSLFTYLTALAFLVLGARIEAGRVVVMIAGVLTILPTYLLARELATALGGGGRRARLVAGTAALLLAVSGPHIAVSSRIAYSNSLTPLFTMTGLWLAQRAIFRRSDRALVGCGVALGLALQTHVSALTVFPGVAAAIMLPWLTAFRRARVTTFWPRADALTIAVGAGLLMVVNLIVYNVSLGPRTASMTGLRVGRYVAEAGGESPWTLSAWGDRLAGLLRAAALAVGSRTSELAAPLDTLLVPSVIVSVALALLGIWIAARRGAWLPLFVTVSLVLSVSLLNSRVEPVVPRMRHYATLVPLGTVMIAIGVVWLYDRVGAWLHGPRWGVWIAQLGLAAVPLLLVASSIASYSTYEAERLGRPDKNNAAYVAVVRAVAGSGRPGERIYLDDALTDVLTMSGGRMITHLRYAFTVAGQEFTTINVHSDSLPLSLHGASSRRLILNAASVPAAAERYRLVPLRGEPGEGAPLRAFRAFPRRR
jgi:4-amino-4-deoxy-L-arabinose transferase-like glycosyltransferase